MNETEALAYLTEIIDTERFWTGERLSPGGWLSRSHWTR